MHNLRIEIVTGGVTVDQIPLVEPRASNEAFATPFFSEREFLLSDA